MQVTITAQPKSSVELAVELSPDELQPFLTRAAAAISREHPLPGFRPGKVPVDVAVAKYGAQAVLEEAAEHAVRDAYVRAVREHNVRSIGSPRVEVTTLAPGNPLRFTATVAVLPALTLPDPATITVKRRAVHVAPEQVDRALEDLRKMQPKETLVDRPAEATDKVVIDLDLARGGVPVEGGQARDYHVYLAEDHDLPAVRDALVGMARGATKTFPVTFPEQHFQKHLAGQTVDATVTVKDISAVELPGIDDAFAKRIGQTDLAALRQLITQNLTVEAERKARDAEEIEMLDAMVNRININDLPELLVTGQAKDMIAELERGVAHQGVPFEEYLKRIEKTHDDLMRDFASEAVRRVKVALATRAIAEREGITADEADVDAEIAEQLKRYAHEGAFHDRIKSEESRDYVRGTLRNRKVIAWLRERVRWTG